MKINIYINHFALALSTGLLGVVGATQAHGQPLSCSAARAFYNQQEQITGARYTLLLNQIERLNTLNTQIGYWVQTYDDRVALATLNAQQSDRVASSFGCQEYYYGTSAYGCLEERSVAARRFNMDFTNYYRAQVDRERYAGIAANQVQRQAARVALEQERYDLSVQSRDDAYQSLVSCGSSEVSVPIYENQDPPSVAADTDPIAGEG